VIAVLIPERDPALRESYRRVTFGADQPEYAPLPAVVFVGPEARVLTRWVPGREERAAIAAGALLQLEVLTFGERLQPVLLSVHDPRRGHPLFRPAA